MTRCILASLSISLVAGCILLTGCGSGGPIKSSQGGSSALPSFELAVGPGTRTIEQGGSTSYTVTLTGENGFDAAVTPTVTGLPSGAAAKFQPESVTPTANGAEATLTVTSTGSGGAAEATPAGTSTLTFKAESGSVSKQVTASLVVTAPPPPASLKGSIN